MVMLTLLRSELEFMLGVQWWRPVTSTLVYDKEGVIVVYRGNTIYKQTLYQVKKCRIFNRWIHYEFQVGDKCVKLNWRSDTRLLSHVIGEMKSWVENKCCEKKVQLGKYSQASVQ